MPLDMQSAWTRYWSSGQNESCCPGDRAAGRLAALDTAWREFFSAFPDGARLIDLATGGGEVIRMAAGLGKSFAITGVDLADLSAVGAALQFPDLNLVGNTDLSKLPFPDAAFEGVTSQFGLEYADIGAATREAVRVMACGGRGRFVLHHAESAITRAGAARLAAYRSVFPDGNALRLGTNVFELYRRSAPRTEIDIAEAEFREAIGASRARLRNEPVFGTAQKVVSFLTELAGNPTGHAAADALRRIDDMRDQVEAFALRTQAQTDAALDRNGIDRVAGSLAEAGAIVSPPKELRHAQGQVLAWSCSFLK